jgi:hypothetical protein
LLAIGLFDCLAPGIKRSLSGPDAAIRATAQRSTAGSKEALRSAHHDLLWRLAEEILDLLAKIPGLKVIAGTSAFYHGRGKFNLRAHVELSRLLFIIVTLIPEPDDDVCERAETMMNITATFSRR